MEKIFLRKKIYTEKIVYALIAFLFLIFMFCTSGNISFWTDELSQVSFIAVPFKEFFRSAVIQGHESMPLWSFFVFFWYKIMSYGEKWLFLLPEIATSLGIYIVALTGKRIGGKWTGIFALIFCCTSSTLILYAGEEFREYGFIFLFSAITIYFWTKRIEYIGKEKNKDIVAYAIAMVLLFFCHPITLMICGSLGIFDLILFIRKKIQLKCVFSYVIFLIISGIYFFRIFTANYKYFTEEASSWIDAPKYADIFNLMKYLTGQQNIVFIAAVFGGGFVLSVCLYNLRMKRKTAKEIIAVLGLTWIAGFSISFAFIYSAFIKPDGSIFILRYFICLIPALMIICGYSVTVVCRYAVADAEKNKRQILNCTFAFFFTIFLGLGMLPVTTNQVSREPFKEASAWLSSQNDIYDENVAVLFTCYQSSIDGCRKYYFYRQGKNKKINIISQYSDKKIKKLKEYDKLYLVKIHNPVYAKTKSQLKKNFVLISENKKDHIMCYEKK